jgi:hypothetical protein
MLGVRTMVVSFLGSSDNRRERENKVIFIFVFLTIGIYYYLSAYGFGASRTQACLA